MEVLSIVSAGPYNVLYVAAFTTALAVAWHYDCARDWPVQPWSAILAVAVVGWLVGSRIFHLESSLPVDGEKTVLGGILGGTLAVLAAIRYMHFDRRAVDAFAAATPVGLAAGKIGCFLVGCCFGRPTDLTWGTTYAPGTAPFAAQVGSGLIAADATSSLHVHPVQLYEAALVLVLAALVLRFGKRLRQPGSAFLFFCAGYAALRFGTEFFRFKQTALAGLTTTQWTLGVAALLLGTALVSSEHGRGRASRPVQHHSYGVAQRRSGHVVVLLAAAVTPMAVWLSPLETLVGAGVTLPLLVVVMNRFLPVRATTAPAFAIAVIGVSVQQNDSTAPRTYVTLGGGAMAGRYQESCGPLHNYRAGGASLAVTREFAGNRSATVRAQLFAGRDETDQAHPRSLDMAGFGLNARFDWTNFGIGVGGSAGNLIFDGGIERVLPSASLRIGSRRRLFLQARLFDHEPAPVPGPILSVGIGHGLDDRGSHVRAGVSGSGIYGAGRLMIGERFGIEPFVARGADEYNVGLFLHTRIGGGRRAR